MADVYYVTQYGYAFLCNEKRNDEYTLWNGWSSICNNKNLVLEYTNNKFTLPQNSQVLFSGCTNTWLDLSKVDTSECTIMGTLFLNCENLTSLDLSTWDTSKVKSFAGMFKGCTALSSLNIPINTSNATNFSSMFSKCNALKALDVSSFTFEALHNDTVLLSGLSNMFSEMNLLSKIIVNPDTDWKLMIDNPLVPGENMFANSPNLPNYTDDEVNINRANTILGYGYFTEKMTKRDLYIKDDSNWINSTIYLKTADAWEQHEVYY